MAPIRYLESYPDLVPSAPVGHPHIISTDFYESTPKDVLTAADGIATLFFNWKPDALAAFLDVDAVPQFEFVRKEKREVMMNTYVARFGRRVMVSNLTLLSSERKINENETKRKRRRECNTYD